MAKKESTFFNMVSTLVVITLVSSALLSSVFTFTSEPIRLSELNRKNEAIQTVVPLFDNVPSEEVSKGAVMGDTLYFYTARMGDSIVGTAVETFTKKGFSGEIRLMVGFKPDGSIIDIAVLKHAETPGLGDKMEKNKSDFSVQFMGQNPESFKLAVKNDNGDVDAITASTISSRAYCDAVQKAYDGFMMIKEKK